MPLPIVYAIGRLLLRLSRVLYGIWRDETARGLLYSVVLLLVTGTVVYRFVEGWTWLDAFYFTVITLTTVGYGDLSPQQSVGKLFTVVYLLLGLGLIASFIAVIARHNNPAEAPDKTTNNHEETGD